MIGRALLLLSAGVLVAGDRPWTLDALMALNTVSDPQIIPDGSSIAYVVRSVNTNRNAYDSEIRIGALGHLATPHSSDHWPRWAGDGRMLAFLSGRDGVTQVYVSDAQGAGIRKITNSPTSVSYFKWSPDSQYIGYLATDPPTSEEARQSKKGADAIVADQGYKYSRLYIVPIKGGEPRLVTKAQRHVTSFDWAPDNLKVAYAGQDTPRGRDFNHVDLYELDLPSGRETVLVRQDGRDADPSYSRDGSMVAFHSQGGTLNHFAERHVGIVPTGGGAIRYVTRGLDLDVFRGGTEFGWSDDAIMFVAGKGTRDNLYRLNLKKGSATCIISSVGSTFSVSMDGKRIAFIRNSIETAPDVYLGEVGSGGVVEHRVSRVNPQAEEYPAIPTRVLRWKSKDGLDVEGVLRLPVGYKPGRRAPLIVELHGGPTGVALEGYPVPRTYPTQLFAQEGFAVLAPNFRGSSNYGARFRQANVKSQGIGDFDDIMTGIDTLVQQGIADPDRLGVAGWSYGGFLGVWIIGHTNRFKAASIGAPSTDWISWYGASDGPRETMWTYFGGKPWDTWQVYNEHSARYSLVNAKTPSLLLHGAKDIDSSAEIFQALTDLKIPNEFVTYPREGHGFSEPMHQRDLMQRNLQWFRRWLAAH
jgi:dipeptidyl aminopeptidase/acylaminoacyl peptidase